MSCGPCDNSFKDFISNCQDTIDVFALLEVSTEYEVIITDKFQHQYKVVYMTDENGYLQLFTGDFPEGLFNPYAGDFKLEVFLDDCDRQSLGISNGDTTNEYDSIVFNVIGGTRDKSNLGCEAVVV